MFAFSSASKKKRAKRFSSLTIWPSSSFYSFNLFPPAVQKPEGFIGYESHRPWSMQLCVCVSVCEWVSFKKHVTFFLHRLPVNYSDSSLTDTKIDESVYKEEERKKNETGTRPVKSDFSAGNKSEEEFRRRLLARHGFVPSCYERCEANTLTGGFFSNSQWTGALNATRCWNTGQADTSKLLRLFQMCPRCLISKTSTGHFQSSHDCVNYSICTK